MRVGSLVETVADFSGEASDWPNIPYPNKGDILTVCDISTHHRNTRVALLSFHELPNTPALCECKFSGELNFKELQPPMDMSFLEDAQKPIIKSIEPEYV